MRTIYTLAGVVESRSTIERTIAAHCAATEQDAETAYRLLRIAADTETGDESAAAELAEMVPGVAIIRE